MSHENHEFADVARNTYVVFSVDLYASPHNETRRRALERFMLQTGIGYKTLQGCYAGTRETAYIVNAKNYESIRADGHVDGQESVLVLGPKIGRDGHRPATLHYLAPDRLPEYLGLFVTCSKEFAEARDAYTYDPADDSYWIATHNPEETIPDAE
jgi:hypothetical protein